MLFIGGQLFFHDLQVPLQFLVIGGEGDGEIIGGRQFVAILGVADSGADQGGQINHPMQG